MKNANGWLAHPPLLSVTAAAVLLLLASCATTPPFAARPWLEDVGDPEQVSLDTPMVIRVNLEVPYLPGSVAPLEEALARRAGDILSRRGYEVLGGAESEAADVDAVPDSASGDAYRLDLFLSGYRVDRVSTQVDQSSGSYTSSLTSSRTVTAYQYDLALEVREGDELVWQGRSSWISTSISPEGDAAYAVRLLASALPADTSVVHQVPRVRENHYDTFYETTLEGRILRSPGIPSVMYIGDPATTSDFGINWDRTMDPPWALAAYADAMENAEEALPTGIEDWSDPFDEFLWRSLRLGGRYRIGDSPEVSHVIVDLVARPEGYVLERGAIVSAEEYEEFEQRLDDWRGRLEEWFDVFE